MKLWHRSRDDDGLRLFTDCARSALGKRNLFLEEKEGVSTSLLLLTDFRQFWARDIWLTGSEWNEKRDFFLHGFKRKYVPIFSNIKPLVLMFIFKDGKIPRNGVGGSHRLTWTTPSLQVK